MEVGQSRKTNITDPVLKNRTRIWILLRYMSFNFEETKFDLTFSSGFTGSGSVPCPWKRNVKVGVMCKSFRKKLKRKHNIYMNILNAPPLPIQTTIYPVPPQRLFVPFFGILKTLFLCFYAFWKKWHYDKLHSGPWQSWSDPIIINLPFVQWPTD